MSVFTEATTGAEGHPCNTCRALFSSIEKVKEHYRAEWHVFNSKRRAAGLAPVSKTEFKCLGPAGGKGSKKGPASPPRAAPLASPPPAATASSVPPEVPLSWGGIRADSEQELRSLATKMGVGSERLEGIIELALVRQDKQLQARAAKAALRPAAAAAKATEGKKGGSSGGGDVEEEEEEDDDDEGEDDDEEDEGPPLGPNISIFDDKEFATPEECVKYMSLKFGFHIPDFEYLTDLEGFLSYLGEKVKLGGLCLYCHKQLRPGRPCQHHMISKGHCKVAYEEDVDLDEFEDFYDFTASYADMPVDEDGEPIELQATVSPTTGELILPDGRIAGHRAYRQYYKQYFAPVESHPGVLAQQREELLRLGLQVGGGGGAGLDQRLERDDILAMPDTQVMTLLIKYHKQVRRHNELQQRAKQQVDLKAKRRENRNRAQQQLNSQRTTDVIRDYHGILM